MYSILNIMFRLNSNCINIQAGEKELFREVISRYKKKAGLSEKDYTKFFFNSIKIEPESGKTISELGLINDSRIDVILSNYCKEEDDVGRIIIITFRIKDGNLMKMQTYSGKILGKALNRFIDYSGMYNEKFHFFLNSLELTDKNKTLEDYKIDEKAIIDIENCESEHCRICLEKENNELRNQLNEVKDKKRIAKRN